MLKKDFLLDQLMIESFGQECNILKEDGFLKMSTRIFMIIYLFIPYSEAGGNGSAAKVMKDVDNLPVHKTGYKSKER